jgi:hypothetical protein
MLSVWRAEHVGRKSLGNERAVDGGERHLECGGRAVDAGVAIEQLLADLELVPSAWKLEAAPAKRFIDTRAVELKLQISALDKNGGDRAVGAPRGQHRPYKVLPSEFNAWRKAWATP